MNFSRVLVASVVLVAGTATGCAPSGADDVGAGAGDGRSRLDPDFKPGRGKRGDAKGTRGGSGESKAKGPGRSPATKGAPTSTPTAEPGAPATSSPSSSATKDPTKSPTTGTTPTPSRTPSASTAASPTATPTPTTGGSASVGDAKGDVRGLTGAPAHADVVGAVVTRAAGGFEVRIRMAGEVPRVWDGSNVENVVAFFDVDLDGQVDYETWGHLAEEGWSASARRPDGAAFGADSGVTATPSGDTLVLTFAPSVIGDPNAFQWSVATEFGNLTQVASGTTSTDFAPDSGGVRFPG